MILLAQKRTNEGIRAAMVDVGYELEDLDYEEIIGKAYRVLWQVWLEHPEEWKILDGQLTIHNPNKDIREAYKRHWDFAILLLEEEPHDDDSALQILESAFYFVQ